MHITKIISIFLILSSLLNLYLTYIVVNYQQYDAWYTKHRIVIPLCDEVDYVYRWLNDTIIYLEKGKLTEAVFLLGRSYEGFYIIAYHSGDLAYKYPELSNTLFNLKSYSKHLAQTIIRISAYLSSENTSREVLTEWLGELINALFDLYNSLYYHLWLEGEHREKFLEKHQNYTINTIDESVNKLQEIIKAAPLHSLNK